MVKEGLLGADIAQGAAWQVRANQAQLGKEKFKQNTQCEGLRPGLSLEGGTGAKVRRPQLKFSSERRQEEVSQCQPCKARGRSEGFTLRARVGVNTCSGVSQLVS